MNHDQWEVYQKTEVGEPLISGEDFPRMDFDDADRLLCKGYNLNGGPNVRVWLDWRGLIGRQFDDDEIEWKFEWAASDLYPSKRAYREETDLRFACLMRERYEALAFTTWRTA